MNPGLRPELPVRRDPYTFQVWILEIRTPRRCDFNTADKLVDLAHCTCKVDHLQFGPRLSGSDSSPKTTVA